MILFCQIDSMQASLSKGGGGRGSGGGGGKGSGGQGNKILQFCFVSLLPF